MDSGLGNERISRAAWKLGRGFRAPGVQLLPRFRSETHGRTQALARMASWDSVFFRGSQPPRSRASILSRFPRTDWSLHAQGTFVGQGRLAIRSPYEGANSLQAQGEFQETVTLTLFVGRKLWPGAELFASPEVTQGTGLTQTLGIAAFPNGEATRANNIVPEISLARLFLRQTINLGGEEEAVAPDLLHFAGTRQTTQLILTFGKLAAPDIFDDNRYSHDPRTQFLSWALMDNGAWDYPADTKGYTMGGVIELEAGPFSVRYGGFMEPKDGERPHLRLEPQGGVGSHGRARGKVLGGIAPRSGTLARLRKPIQRRKLCGSVGGKSDRARRHPHAHAAREVRSRTQH